MSRVSGRWFDEGVVGEPPPGRGARPIRRRRKARGKGGGWASVRLAGAALAVLLFPFSTAWAQGQVSSPPAGKRPLPISDYRFWRTISGETISPDGQWVAWTYRRERGDDTLHVARVGSDVHYQIPLGSEPRFSDDARWVAYFLAPPFAEAEAARREDKPVIRKVELLRLSTGDRVAWEDVESFEFNRGGTHLLIRKRRKDPRAEIRGRDLILRGLRAGYDELLGSVDEAAFNKRGNYLAFTVDAVGGDGNGLYLVDLTTGLRRALDQRKGRYSRLSWAPEGDGVAVLRGEVPAGKTERENTLVAVTGLGEAVARRAVFEPAQEVGIPAGWVVSEKGEMVWSEDLATLFVGIAPQREKLEPWPKDALPLADVNIWHWADDRLQSVQQRQAARDRDRTFLAAVHLGDLKVVPLGDSTMLSVQPTPDGRWAVGSDGSRYLSDWKPPLADYYRIDPRTGERERFLEAQFRTFGLSPDGKHFLYWKDRQFWLYELSSGRHRNLSARSPVSFVDEAYDHPGEPPPYGVAGWVQGGKGVVLNHRYDLWLQPLDGSPPINLTQGVGERDEVVLRYVRTDPEERWISLDRPLLLSAYGRWSKKEGFFRLAEGRMDVLAWEDRKFSRPLKARNADRFLFTVQTFREFPDLWVSGWDFADRVRLTVANPQQEEYLWGGRILFEYTNRDGVRLQGTLAVPDSYQPGRRLPMIVRFYEDYSQDLHLYPTPAYRHAPNFAGYVSNGYLVMQPDIHFRTGTTHSDMLECVEAAVQKVIEMGYADPARIGLSGHSFSGGGAAYIATRSNLFAAVAHGAAPINLVSEFNQLFKSSGQNNHRYDIYGQGRYGTDPYENFQLYWDQSPISGVQNLNTPILYLHGEEDGTVNWEQGLEWYNALRFLGKPIIWLSYPKEGHGLQRLENRIDFQMRLMEFFDHHLKGAPAPEWMTRGVPYLQKEQHLRQYAPRFFDTPPSGRSGGTETPQGERP